MIDQIMARLRRPARWFARHRVEVADVLPDTDAPALDGPGGRVVLRPSGTEPKLKAYVQVIVPDGSRPAARRRWRSCGSERSRGPKLGCEPSE